MASYKGIALWFRDKNLVLYRWAHIIVPLALVFAAVSMRVAQWSWVEAVQYKAFDSFLNLRPRPYEPAPVRILDIDDETLEKLGQWPWPRTLLARMILRLNDLGAAVIAFDATFPEPDRTSPSRLASLWSDVPQIQDLRERIKGLPDHDAIFARAISKARVVTGFALTAEANDKRPSPKASYAYAGDGPLAYLDDFPGAVVNLPVIEKAAVGNGCIGFVAEHDGVIRRVSLIFRMGRALLPSLAAESLRVAQGATNYAVKSSGASGESSYGQHTGINRIKIGSYVVPTDAKGRVWVYYTEPAPERVIPAWRVFQKNFDRARLEGCIVFVGTSAAGLRDLRATPLNPAAAGVEVHANIAEQVLLGQFLQRPDWAAGAEVLYMLVLGLGLLLLLPRLGAGLSALVGFVGVGAALAVSWRAFTVWHYLIDPVFPCVTVILIYMSSSMISFLKSENERRQVKGAFSRYMAPTMVEVLAKHPEKLKLGGELRNMTFHFCDIEGFTTISEFYEPNGLIRFLNRFLTPMTEIILSRKGTIDKYIGDCIMAFWNAPLDDPEHAKNACLAVLEMHDRLEHLNEERRIEAEATGKKFIPVRIRTGLNTGNCIVGNMGSEQRFDYSVLSDDVNLASRLEGANKFFGTHIMASEATIQGAGDAVISRELGRVRVVGKATPIRVFEPLAKKGELSPDWEKFLPLYGKGREHFYKKDFERAIELFKEALEVMPGDGPASKYLKAAMGYIDSPPPAEWDGVFNLTSK